MASGPICGIWYIQMVVVLISTKEHATRFCQVFQNWNWLERRFTESIYGINITLANFPQNRNGGDKDPIVLRLVNKQVSIQLLLHMKMYFLLNGWTVLVIQRPVNCLLKGNTKIRAYEWLGQWFQELSSIYQTKIECIVRNGYKEYYVEYSFDNITNYSDTVEMTHTKGTNIFRQ